MKLKGGVLIIGSLFWEDHLDHKKKDNIRRDWRNHYLMGLDISILTKAPIRYGRQSSTRSDTFTMVFSKSCEVHLGQARIVPFKEDILSFDDIERQAIALAIAEGIFKSDNKRLTSSWGSVALLLSPKLIEKDSAIFELFRKKWGDIYKGYSETFVSSNYKAKNESDTSITQTGLLNINWQKEMDGFDMIIATPVIPKPKAFPSISEIYTKMNTTGYVKYFKENQKNGIVTFQDDDIKDGIVVQDE